MEKIRVAAGIVLKHDHFLATQRPDGKPLAGYWELPGGKCEGSETPEEALVRELAEELGINVLGCKLLETMEYPYPERGFIAELHFFVVHSFKGEPCPRENQNLRWVNVAEAMDMDFLPADASLLERLPNILR